ncbi:MAG: hypothetical protein Q4C70_14255, partial [Planctomycetia bacterium]|nr:hypothetical protein [Planctomycetia bacterium]
TVSDSDSASLHSLYICALEPWVKAANQEIRFLADGTAIYGLAQHGHWYMQAHDTAFCAYAVLGTDTETDENRVGMTREELRKTALAMLRFTLRSHIAGGGACTDGKPWGHTWISQLGLERMTPGIEALKDYLDDELRVLLAKVYASEADYLLKVPVTADLLASTGKNCPESNMWKGATLIRAGGLNPEHENCEKWREKACQFLINAMATPSDEKNETVVDGKPVRERFVGANMFDSRACNHHGYQNVGYMNITLSNLALIHFWCREHGVTPPEALYFNALEQWKVVKMCTFDDGRLLRVGGDTRIRYCYCQDYAIFCWLLARDIFGDADTEKFERGWIQQVIREQETNPSGWYMKERLSRLWNLSPLYFTRLEGDKVCTLAAAAYWRRTFNFEKMETHSVSVPTQWHDEYHGAWLQKGAHRIASWTWRGAQKAGGLCIPTNGSDLAEWQNNLAGRIYGVGKNNIAQPDIWTGFTFDGGFATCGKSFVNSTGPLAEGDHSPLVARLYVAYCALPDDRTVVAIQYARAAMNNYVTRVRGLSLSIPNDAVNGFTRKIMTADGVQTLNSKPGKYELIGNSGKWLNVDDKLGVVEIYGGTPKVARMATRSEKITDGYLYCDEIAQECAEGATFISENASIFDCAAVVMTADSAETHRFSENGDAKRISTDDPKLRLISVRGEDGITYFIAANFSTDVKPFDAEKVFGTESGGKKLFPLGETATTLESLGIGVWRVE